MHTPSEQTIESDRTAQEFTPPRRSSSVQRLHDSLDEVKRRKQLVALERSLHREESLRRHETHAKLLNEALVFVVPAGSSEQALHLEKPAERVSDKAVVDEVLIRPTVPQNRRASLPLNPTVAQHPSNPHPRRASVAHGTIAPPPYNPLLCDSLGNPKARNSGKIGEPRRNSSAAASDTKLFQESLYDKLYEKAMANQAQNNAESAPRQRRPSYLAQGDFSLSQTQHPPARTTDEKAHQSQSHAAALPVPPAAAQNRSSTPVVANPRRASYANPFDPNVVVVPRNSVSVNGAPILPSDPIMDRRSHEDTQTIGELTEVGAFRPKSEPVLPFVAKYHLEALKAQGQGFSLVGEFDLMRIAIQREFSRKNLDYDSNTSLGTVNWIQAFGSSTNRFLHNRVGVTLFRTLLAMFMVGIWAWSLTEYKKINQFGAWPIYLTNWVLSIDMVYCVLSFVLTLRMPVYEASQHYKDNPRDMPLLVSVVWFLQGLALPGSLLVMLAFWLFVVDFTFPPQLFMIFTHGVNFLLLFLDTFINNQPFLLLHGLYFVLLSVVYGVWTIIFHLLHLTDGAGNPWIYKVADWSKPLSTGTLGFALIIFVFPLIIFVLWWTLFVRRTAKLYKQMLSAVRAAQDDLIDLEKAARKARAVDTTHLPRVPSFVLVGEDARN
eukprot:c39377_g1_i1.p1 GENE.c39377_g1_i1~~c39377_g1_i1.p1  ORF type:complete len:662 (+),score=135.61 c39377_g1_i1:89-2074(+)